MVFIDVYHHNGNADKLFLKYVVPLYFMSTSEILWNHTGALIKSKLKISQRFPPFFFSSIWNYFPLCSYLFFTSLYAESTLRKDSIPILLVLLRQTFGKNAFKILLFPIWRRWEKKEPLFNRILENHLNSLKSFMDLRGNNHKRQNIFSLKLSRLKKYSVYFPLSNKFSTSLDGGLSNLV